MATHDAVHDYLFRGSLDQLDPDVAALIRHETNRQARYLILVPSESTVPEAVRAALSSAFHNIYAEGYPLESDRQLREDEILDYGLRLAEHRRIGDERYYMGTEYANIVESLARRRTAEVFAANGLTPDQLYVNVQPLSGAPANNAIYTALVKPGDTIMGMDLIEGGHLTHGSPVNRSGKFFNVVSYGIDPETGDIDYAGMMALAKQHQPRLIIGGYSSFPHQADWARYREVADAVGAILVADIAHVSGLVAAGAYPSPVGIADVVNFTTHKTLNGPRGAVLVTHRKELARKLDRGVFPGEQGGPHVNQIAALAVAMKLATTEQFRNLQHQTVTNAARLAHRLAERGLTIAYGGTSTHLLSIDLRSLVGPDGTRLSGEMAARLLNLVGLVANRQTIPGDKSALKPSGVRLGTPWITQRGFKEAEVDELADIIADLLLAAVPMRYLGRRGGVARAKVPFAVLMQARQRVSSLAERSGIDTEVTEADYPHFFRTDLDSARALQIRIRGEAASQFLNAATTSDVTSMRSEQANPTLLLHPDGRLLASGVIGKVNDTEYLLHVNENGLYVTEWLRALSDGFVLCDEDPYARLPGPVDVTVFGTSQPEDVDLSEAVAQDKAFFIGMKGIRQHNPDLKLEEAAPLPRFEWTEPDRSTLMTTTLYDLHKELGGRMVEFAGYDMPVWYSSVSEEHLAVRQSAGVFDVSHMGVFDFQGPGAADFLDAVTTNDVHGLAVGSSHYTYLLDVDGIPLDDLMIYRLGQEHFLLVVNASNNDKNWAWLKAVKNHRVMVDPAYPARLINDSFVMRDLRDRSVGDAMRVDIALQGPESKAILTSLAGMPEDKTAITDLPWAGVTQVTLGGYDMIVARTGYTGERVAYELFVHPDKAPRLFQTLVELGATPCGLAARDSLRTEAGLPLYGHELEGPLMLGPAEAGFGNYVKIWKPFFVGRQAFVEREATREAVVTRFRLEAKGARPPHQGDPVVDNRGRIVGFVTSCSIDSEGYQLGQVYLSEEYAAEGTQLGVFSGSSRMKPVEPNAATLGKRITVPDQIVILSRFPRRK